MVLLHLLRWLRSNDPDLEFDVLLIEGGPLADEYRKLSNVTVLSDRRTFAHKAAGRLLRILGLKQRIKLPDLASDYDAVLGNTIVSLEVLEHFAARGIRTICWVHEMEYVVRLYFEPTEFTRLMNRVDRLILGSNAVRKMLTKFGVETPADVVYELQPPSGPPARSGAQVRASFRIPEDAFVVIGCGLIGWRKGVDIFLDVAGKLADVYFIWLGGRPAGDDEYADEIDRRIASTDAARIIFPGEQRDLGPFFAAADVFALTSREDPFPLVCLVAADNGLPTICFSEAGGIPELVGDDAGVVVPFGESEAFATAITDLYRDRERGRELGRNAKAKFDGPFSIGNSAARIAEILKNDT